MTGARIEKALARALIEEIGNEAERFALELRNAIIDSRVEGIALLRDRLGEGHDVYSIHHDQVYDVLGGMMDLSEDVMWVSGIVTIMRMRLTDTMMVAVRGEPVTAVVDHRWLDDGMLIESIQHGSTTLHMHIAGETSVPIAGMATTLRR